MSMNRKLKSKLVRKCPVCRRLRKFKEPPGDQGGERHPRRPAWRLVTSGYLAGIGEAALHPTKVCGWCASRLNAESFVDTGIGGIKRDAKTGRVVKETP